MSLFDLFFEEIPDEEQENDTGQAAGQKNMSDNADSTTDNNNIQQIGNSTAGQAQEDKNSQEKTSPDLTEEEKRLMELGKAQQEFKTRYKTKVVSHTFISLVTVVALFIVSVSLILFFVAGFYKVNGDGMSPVIKDGEYVLVNRLAYKIRSPQRGDIICAGGKLYRIIGLPGEDIKLYAGHVYIDGKIADEQYLDNNAGTYSYSDQCITGTLDGYFVLCDNRSCYEDSRSGILVLPGDIEGRVVAY